MRAIDCGELEKRISSLARLARSDAQKSLLGRVLYIVENMPTLTQPNEPLTLEELRKIDTVIPLWVHNLSWGQHEPRLMLVRHVTSNYWSCVDFDGFETIKSDDYGSRYLIYRRPPEGGNDVR